MSRVTCHVTKVLLHALQEIMLKVTVTATCTAYND